MSILSMAELYGRKRTRRGIVPSYRGEIEIEIRDRNGKTISRQSNLVKIFAKEILAHRTPPQQVWDPTAGSGSGAWVDNGLNLDDYAPRYICFGASYDQNGIPLDSADARFYSTDTVTGAYVPITLGVGAEYDGGLINAIPISNPNTPLKRVERIFFENSYQPAGSPMIDSDVRAMNNIVLLETTLRKDEYNGFGSSSSDFFTITEVALVGAPAIADVAGTCDCGPRGVFLQGDGDNLALPATATGTATVTLGSGGGTTGAVNAAELIKEGDQVKITAAGAAKDAVETLGQVTPYYLVISKALNGSDMVLDRTPMTEGGVPIVGSVGVFQDNFRIYAHRILKSPFKKSADFEIVVRWRLIYN